MQFFKKQTNIDFVGKRNIALIFSAVLIAFSIGAVIVRGLNFGIDFTGGVLLEMGYAESVDLSEVRTALANGGFGDAIVQHFGTAKDVMVRLAPREGISNAEISSEIMRLLSEASSVQVQMRRVEFVGPQVGDELVNDGALAMLFALLGVLVYVALRFEYRFALGSVAALAHDVIITIGFFAVTQLDFDLTVLAAVLAVIGYSLNDTIVVFDRIRENFRIVRKGSAEEITNLSVNQTLSRTIMTGVTTLLVLVALLMLGGELLRGFSAALIVGILIGTYSSIYIAAALALALGVSKEDLIPPQKEGAEIDDRP